MSVFDDDDFPDFEELSIGEPHNDSYGAICGMLTEHIVDADRLNRWLIGLMVVALKEVDALDIELRDALEAIETMNYSDMAISGFDSMNTLVGITKQNRKRRGRRTEG